MLGVAYLDCVRERLSHLNTIDRSQPHDGVHVPPGRRLDVHHIVAECLDDAADPATGDEQRDFLLAVVFEASQHFAHRLAFLRSLLARHV